MDFPSVTKIITPIDVTLLPHWKNPLGMDYYFTALPGS
jgi:hypothetical protein